MSTEESVAIQRVARHQATAEVSASPRGDTECATAPPTVLNGQKRHGDQPGDPSGDQGTPRVPCGGVKDDEPGAGDPSTSRTTAPLDTTLRPVIRHCRDSDIEPTKPQSTQAGIDAYYANRARRFEGHNPCAQPEFPDALQYDTKLERVPLRCGKHYPLTPRSPLSLPLLLIWPRMLPLSTTKILMSPIPR